MDDAESPGRETPLGRGRQTSKDADGIAGYIQTTIVTLGEMNKAIKKSILDGVIETNDSSKMKKYLTCLKIFTVLSFVFLALTSHVGYSQFLIKGGLTSATVNFQETYAQKYSPVQGTVFGIGYNSVRDSSSFGVLVEVLRIEKGAIDVYDTHGSVRYRSETNTKVNYLEIPIMVKYTMGHKKIQPYLNIGFSIGVGLGGDYKNVIMNQDPYPNGPMIYTTTNGKVVFAKQTTASRELNIDNRTDVGIQLGAGFTFFKRLVLDFRYGMGLTDLYDQDMNSSTVNPSSKNRVTQFSLGYQFANLDDSKK